MWRSFAFSLLNADLCTLDSTHTDGATRTQLQSQLEEPLRIFSVTCPTFAFLSSNELLHVLFHIPRGRGYSSRPLLPALHVEFRVNTHCQNRHHELDRHACIEREVPRAQGTQDLHLSTIQVKSLIHRALPCHCKINGFDQKPFSLLLSRENMFVSQCQFSSSSVWPRNEATIS